jgi:chorismate mutase
MICVRGATTTEKNERNDILQATKEMLECIIVKNELELCDIIQIQFTMTKDLDAVYPAVAAREIGITEAALMCTQELYVVGSLKKCIRCAVLCDVDKKQKQANHIYLQNAKALRPDLTNKEKEQ